MLCVFCFFYLIPSPTLSAKAKKPWYTVQIAAFRDIQNANEYKKQLQKQLPAEIFTELRSIPQGKLHFLYIGCVPSHKEAAKILKTITPTHPDAFVYKLSDSRYAKLQSAKKGKLSTSPHQKRITTPAVNPQPHFQITARNNTSVNVANVTNAEPNITANRVVPPSKKSESNVVHRLLTEQPLLLIDTFEEEQHSQSSSEVPLRTNQTKADNTPSPISPFEHRQSEESSTINNFLAPPPPTNKANYAVMSQGTQTTFVALGLFLSGILWWVLSRRDKKIQRKRKPLMHSQKAASTKAKSVGQHDTAQNGTSPLSEATPRLPKALEKLLSRSGNALSMVEANIHSRDRTAQSIYVTSCFSGEGKTVSALHLAWGLAHESRLKILLVDWNHSSPQLEKLFGIPQSPGLVQYLKKEVEREKCIYETAYEGLSVMPIGDTTGRLTEISRTDELDYQLEILSRDYDYIIFDGHSLMGAATAILADRFDGIMLTVEAERTKWEVVQEATEKIEKMGGEILGIVLNKRRFYIPKFLYGKI
jgi:capsular exopolysaccharide synthesis family protein